jgi:hypothetical protein
VVCEWRPVTSAPLVLGSVAGHRGRVLDACLCAPDAAVPPSADLVWLLHRPESDHTELLRRRVPLTADGWAAGGQGGELQRLGSHAAGRRLLCAGGGDLWVWTARGSAHRWCMRAGACVARVSVGATPLGSPDMAPLAALHHPSRELLACTHDGALLAVGPPLRAAADVDNGFADPQQAAAAVVRRVGTLRHPHTPLAMAASGALCMVLSAAATSGAPATHAVTVHHAATGVQVAATTLPPGGAGRPHLVVAGSDVLFWRSGTGTSLCALWRLAPSPSAALGVITHRVVPTTPAAARAVMRDAAAYGDSLEQVHACAALGSVQHAAAGGGPDDGTAAALEPRGLHPSLRSLVPVAASLVAQGVLHRPTQAAAWEQVTAALQTLHEHRAQASAEDAAAAFRAYTPVGAAMAAVLRSGGAPARRSDDVSPVAGDAVAAAMATAQQFLQGQPATWLGWKQAGLAVAATALRDSAARKDNATSAVVTLFMQLLEGRPALQPVCDGAECAACDLQVVTGPALRLFRSPAEQRNAVLAAALARATRCDWDGLDAAAVWDAPPFESVCLCLAATLCGALPVFVRSCAALPAAPGGATRQLALRALRVLPRVTCRCAAASRDATAAHAKLLCMAGHQCAAMWLALHPTAPGQQPDWHAGVRLLEREAAASPGGAALIVVPLMFEVFAARVCDALAPMPGAGANSPQLLGVSAEDESEALAACVAHLFIAAKAVAALIKREGTATQTARKVRWCFCLYLRPAGHTVRGPHCERANFTHFAVCACLQADGHGAIAVRAGRTA